MLKAPPVLIDGIVVGAGVHRVASGALRVARAYDLNGQPMKAVAGTLAGRLNKNAFRAMAAEDPFDDAAHHATERLATNFRHKEQAP